MPSKAPAKHKVCNPLDLPALRHSIDALFVESS
jgi:hypothetical protein